MTQKFLCLLLCFLLALRGAAGSLGDRQPAYVSCVSTCAGLDCAYTCMHSVEAARRAAGARPLQYHGKWPFVRIAGLTEPASVVFSLLNLFAHFRGFARFRASLPPSYPPAMRVVWSVYAALSCCAWAASCVYHAKDTFATTVVDYFVADSLLVFSLFSAAVRAGRLFSFRAWAPLGATLSTCLALHCYRMVTVRFDYGLNVRLAAAVGASQSAVLVVWSQAVAHPQRWRLLGLLCCLHAASALELLDFPPLWGLVDAHAMWHAATPLAVLEWYSFLAKDAAWMTRPKDRAT